MRWPHDQAVNKLTVSPKSWKHSNYFPICQLWTSTTDLAEQQDGSTLTHHADCGCTRCCLCSNMKMEVWGQTCMIVAFRPGLRPSGLKTPLINILKCLQKCHVRKHMQCCEGNSYITEQTDVYWAQGSLLFCFMHEFAFRQSPCECFWTLTIKMTKHLK